MVVLTKSLARSEARYGIRCNIINPGFTQAYPASLATSFKEAQRIMSEDVDPPIIPVGQPIDVTYYRTDIKGQVSNPLYIFTWDFYALSRG